MSNTKATVVEDHSNALVIRDGFPALLHVDENDPTGNSSAATTTKIDDDDKSNDDKTNSVWWINETDETMKLPRGDFWSHDEAIQFFDDDKDDGSTAVTTTQKLIIKDCYKVFTARTRNDDASYSAGTTYFLPALMKPRCALEGLVQLIFHQHTSLLPRGMYKPEQSGAEWWTLVLGDDDNITTNDDDDVDVNSKNKKQPAKASKEKKNSEKQKKNKKEEEDDEEDEEDDVGWHYDADYGLEDQAPGLLLHPRVATVTYLSDWGAPTVVTNCFTPLPQGNVQTLHDNSITKAYVSYPKIGKHMAFDGRLLHGAPSDIFPSLQQQQPQQQEEGDDDHPNNNDEEPLLQLKSPPPSKRLKTNHDRSEPVPQDRNKTQQQQQQQHPRITLLVNIWLNHCPLDAELLDEEILGQLQTPWKEEDDKPQEDEGASKNNNSSTNKLFRWNSKADLTQDTSLATTQIQMSSVPPCSITATTAAPAAAAPAAAAAKAPDKDDDDDDDDTLEDEIVLCNHRVRVKYGAKLEDYHAVASALTLRGCGGGNEKDKGGGSSNSSSIVVELAKGAMTLHVGDPVSDSEEEEEGAEEEE